MKNRQIERMLYQARQHHRHQRGCRFRGGILFFQQYDHIAPDALTRSADVEFVLGGRRISVTWRHPRQVYRDKIDDAVYAAGENLYSEERSLFNDTNNKRYRKVGKSRKKISWYTTSESGNAQWAAAFEKEEERLRQEADFTIYPSLRVGIYNWCRRVDIVAPIEVRSFADLKNLAELVRRLLKREVTLDAEFPSYVYDRGQWISEDGDIRSRYSYTVVWFDDDKEYVGLCAEFPSLSFLAKTHKSALYGIQQLVENVVAEMQASGEIVPKPFQSINF